MYRPGRIEDEIDQLIGIGTQNVRVVNLTHHTHTYTFIHVCGSVTVAYRCSVQGSANLVPGKEAKTTVKSVI